MDNDIAGIEESSGEVIAEASPTWFWDDATPGVGERPSYLPEKFKSVADAAKSYNELEKRLGQAPSEYSFDTAKDWLDPTYGAIEELASFARDKHVPQEVMDKMFDSVGKYLNEFMPDQAAEKAALGDNAKERLDLLNNWAKANFSEETYFGLTNNLKTAEAVKAVEEIRRKMIENNTSVPTGNESGTPQMPSLSELQDELTNNLEKYKTDEKYRKDLSSRFELASKQGPFRDKHSY